MRLGQNYDILQTITVYCSLQNKVKTKPNKTKKMMGGRERAMSRRCRCKVEQIKILPSHSVKY